MASATRRQALTGLALQLNAARKLVAGDRTEDAGQTLAGLEKRTQETIAEMRRLVYGLRPPALDYLGLILSIRQQAESHGMVDPPAGASTDGPRDTPVFSMQVPEPLPPLPAAVEVACYRIAQEAITNVSRHARAERCSVRVSVDGAVLKLEIADDGHAEIALPARECDQRGQCRRIPGPAVGQRNLGVLRQQA